MRRRGAALALAAALLIAGAAISVVGTGVAPLSVDNPFEESSSFGVNLQRSDPRGYVFDDSVVRRYEIILSEEAEASLKADPTAEEYVAGTVVIDGERHEGIGVRYKGFFGALRACFDAQGRQTCPRLSYKLKFNEYDPDGRFHGLKRLNLQSMQGDETHMRERLSYEMFREAGVPAPRSAYAYLIVNGEHLGVYTLTEDIDDRFIADRFLDRGDGILFKEIWPGNVRRGAPFAPTIEAAVRRGPDEPDLSRFEAFSDAVASAETGEEAWRALLEHADEDQIYRFLAADRLTDNWDGIVAWYCVPVCANHNYFWFEDARTGRFTLIPWDVEQSWRDPTPIRTYYEMPDWDEPERGCALRKVFWDLDARAPYCDALIGAMASEGWEGYIEASRRLLAEYPEQRLHARVDEVAALYKSAYADAAETPAVREWLRDWGGAVKRLHEEIGARYAYIEQKIAAWDEDGRRPGE